MERMSVSHVHPSQATAAFGGAGGAGGFGSMSHNDGGQHPPASHSLPPTDVCAGCKRTGLNLLVCDDCVTSGDVSGRPNIKQRFCSECMIGKKVRVFWPLDEQWYVGVVQRYDHSTGEHLLTYPDGDTEWVKIGESNTQAGEVGEDSPSKRAGNAGEMAPMEQHQHQYEQPESRKSSPDKAPPRAYGSPEQSQPPPTEAQAYGGLSPYPHPHHGMSNPSMASHHGTHSHPHSHYGYQPYGAPHPQSGHYPPPHYYPHPQHPHGHGHGHGQHPGHGSNPQGGKRGLNPMSPESKGSMAHAGPKRKSGPKTWTKEEDNILLSMVRSMRMPMKWSIVAHSMPDRTGKQCRERYVNHLNPRLKITEWSPSEDATIFHLYNTSGSQWAKMSKMIPGRTDNGIKNRFHNLRRQLEREDDHRLRLSKPEDFPDEIRLDRIRPFPLSLRGKSDDLWDMRRGIGVIAAQSVLGGGIARNAGRFGPFRAADTKGEQCARCGLFAPSAQCGTELCSRTRWCLSCTRVPPHVSGNLLRECLNLRRCQEADQAKLIHSWGSLRAQTDDETKTEPTDERNDNNENNQSSSVTV